MLPAQKMQLKQKLLLHLKSLRPLRLNRLLLRLYWTALPPQLQQRILLLKLRLLHRPLPSNAIVCIFL